MADSEPKSVANPLFVKWLEEYLQKLRIQQPGSKFEFTIKKALTNMKSYPLELSSGLEAKCISGIGDKLASMLEKRLKEHYNALGKQYPQPESPDATNASGSAPLSQSASEGTGKAKKPR
eukprot:Sdes_comp11892_c0_seq1m2902